MIDYTVNEGIALITINRPDKRNALDPATLVELRHALEEAQADAAIQSVIITGAGDKAFASGADIGSLQELTALHILAGTMQEVFSAIEGLSKPVIAAVNGYALGGGCELAMACDLRVAAENARFGQPEVGLGILAGAGGTQRLARLVGLGRAKELLLTGAIIDAQEAYRIGLVNRVVPQGEAVAGAKQLAQAILAQAPLAVRLTKLVCQVGHETDLRTGLLLERLAEAFLFTTEDKKEGISAFLEGRAPNFRGR